MINENKGIKSGIVGVLKPKGISSFDLIRKIRQVTGIKNIGHAGTLDPLASGVLVIGIGKQACQKLNNVVKKEKEYIAKIKLGINSTTDDEEGGKKEVKVDKIPLLSQIREIIPEFQGKIYQTPPIFSAIKIHGQPAYKLARQGKKPILKKRLVEAKQIKVLKYDWPYLTLKIITGPGFYIRSLARDLGQKLKTGGYLAELERTRVGDFKKKNCLLINDD